MDENYSVTTFARSPQWLKDNALDHRTANRRPSRLLLAGALLVQLGSVYETSPRMRGRVASMVQEIVSMASKAHFPFPEATQGSHQKQIRPKEYRPSESQDVI
jgi:hypothetical protein